MSRFKDEDLVSESYSSLLVEKDRPIKNEDTLDVVDCGWSWSTQAEAYLLDD